METSYENFKKFSDKQFIRYVRIQYIWNNRDSLLDFLRKSKVFRKNFKRRETVNLDRKTIVFITGNLTPRSVKIISALNKKRYKVIVLGYGKGSIVPLVKKELTGFGVNYFNCSDVVELFYLSLQYKPLLYIFEPAWGDCSWPDLMIRHKKLFGKIVMAVYDTLNDCYVQVSDFQLSTERYCLENADGVIWRFFSKEYLEEKKGFHYKGKSIQFLDYCAGYNIDENLNKDNGLKLCFIVGSIDYFLESRNGRNYIEEARIEDILKVIGNREDCVFHIFTGTFRKRDKEICDALEKEYPNFKVFYNLEHDKLIKKISGYDYGCYFYTNGKKIPDMETVNNLLYGSAYVNSISNKHFDYIDAEIPIITTAPFKSCEFFAQYGIVVKMDISNLDFEYLKKNKIFYKENVKKAKKELLIDNQIQRMIDFFQEL